MKNNRFGVHIIQSIVLVTFVVSALGCLSCASTGPEKAKKAFGQGVELERAKKYKEASEAFSEATLADGTFATAYRERAACQYYLGFKASAYASYDHYLALNPSDLRTKAFADTLRKQIKFKEIDLDRQKNGKVWVCGWGAPSGDVQSYNVYYSEKSGTGYSKAANVSEEALLMRGLEKNKKFYFVLTALTSDSPPIESKPSMEFFYTSY